MIIYRSTDLTDLSEATVRHDEGRRTYSVICSDLETGSILYTKVFMYEEGSDVPSLTRSATMGLAVAHAQFLTTPVGV